MHFSILVHLLDHLLVIILKVLNFGNTGPVLVIVRLPHLQLRVLTRADQYRSNNIPLDFHDAHSLPSLFEVDN